MTGAAGELALTLCSDGRAELRYQEVRLGLSDPFVDEAIINGIGTLGWQVLDGQLIFSELSNLTVSIVTPAFSDDPITFTERRFPTLDGRRGGTINGLRRIGSSLSMSDMAGSFATLPDRIDRRARVPACLDTAGDAPASG